MKKILTSSITLGIAFSFLVGVPVALALSTYVDSVDSFTQGLRKNGTPVLPERSDPTKALGPEDGVFVSLGYGGTLILKFPLTVGGTLTITTFETTWGGYPTESAEVWVSRDGASYELIGTATNLVNQPSNNPHPSVFNLTNKCVRYVKLVDTTNKNLHSAESDGFDIDAVKADYTKECKECCIGDIRVFNRNKATVQNEVTVVASTGNNTANGDDGGDAKAKVFGNGTATAGNGGSGGDGGTIVTGDAYAKAKVINIVNTNITRIRR